MSFHGGFRVVLDLEPFFDDSRRRCYFYVDLNRHKTVRDVKEGIKARCGIKDSIGLEVNGCFVPENEVVHVLYNEDVIRVIDSDISFQATNKLNTEVYMQNEVVRKVKKRRQVDETNDDKICTNNNGVVVVCNEGVLERCEKKEEENGGIEKKRKKSSSDCKTADGVYDSTIQERYVSYEGETRSKKKKKKANDKIESVQIRDNGASQASVSKLSNSLELPPKIENGNNYVTLLKESESKKTKKTSQEPECKDENLNIFGSRYVEVNNSILRTEELVQGGKAEDGKNTSILNNLNIVHSVENYEVEPEALNVPTGKVENSFPTNNRTVENGLKEEISTNDLNGSVVQGEVHARKRRRRRKRASKQNDLSEVVDNAPSQEFVFHPPAVYDKARTHIKFPDDDGDDDYSDGTNTTGVNNVGDDDTKPMSKGLNGKDTLYPSNGNAIISSNNIVDSNLSHKSEISPPTSLVQNGITNKYNSKPVVSSGHSSPLIFECKKKAESPSIVPVTEAENKMDFTKYPLMKGFPRENDVIAFKKWKMDDNYCPGISEYISARVLQASKEDKSVTLRILYGHSELKEPTGKFSLTKVPVEEEEEEEEEILNTESVEILQQTMNFSDFLEVRLIYP